MPSVGEALPRARTYPSQEAGWKRIGGEQPCVVTPCCNNLQPQPACSSTSGFQPHACALPKGTGGAPRTHTEPWLQKSSLPERYTTLLPGEKISPRILQGAHAAARNSHSNTWLEHRQPAPGSHAAVAASSASLAGEPGTPPGPTRLLHPAPRCAPAGLRRVLRAEGSSPPGLLTGCWLQGRELTPAQFAGACCKSSLCLFGPHVVLPHGRPNLRAGPRTGQAPAAVRGCAMETGCSSQGEAGELERMAPALAGRWGGVSHAGSHRQHLLGCRATLCPRRLSAQHPVPQLLAPTLAFRSQPSFPGWGGHALQGDQRPECPNRSFAHKGVSGELGSQVWMSVCQVFLFSYSAL